MHRTVFIVSVSSAVMASSAGAGMIFASSVEQFDQLDRKNGSSVSGNRSDPLRALGAPEGTDTLNFVSLGLGGSITLGFDSSFGGDVTVWETTYGNPSGHPERAEVWVGDGPTWDTADWFLAGALGNDEDGAPISLSGIGGGVGAFEFLRIVDVTDPSLHGGGADGFDVDGVAVSTVPTPGSAALAFAGLAVTARTRRRLG